ncbi:amidohydrolase family protein [Antrihabitans sp. YC2-6]|uniref:amidohydrolase family protein n=1 Tax=Antrihabitans sp. YC2-6 TaxID=2799498 RepID=UPI0018F55A69|nr:amidohydrolase family protein [Antrihabitans sp. YC2-6]MBJ8347235.1 amidohydrolase [Antrihabitans sp. YC2-6]
MNDDKPATTWSRRKLLGTSAAAAAGVAGASLVGARAATAAPVGVRTSPFRREQLPSGNYRIDMHAHFLPPDYRNAMISRGMFTAGGFPLPQWSPEAAIGFMDAYGIQAQTLSISDPGVGFLRGREAIDMARYCNSYAADLFRSHPTRFGGFAVLPMPDVLASIAEVEYALDVLHLDGVVLLSAYDGIYLGDPRFEPLMIALNARSAYVFVHPGSIPDDAKPATLPDFLVEYPFDTTRAAATMITSGTMNRYPRIRFQLSHAGGTVPFLSNRLGLLSNSVVGQNWPAGVPTVSLFDSKRLIESFYYDTALSDAPAEMLSVLAVTQRQHIVFGTDWPFASIIYNGAGDPAPQLSETFSAEERVEIERTNPLRELPRLAAAVG